MNMIVVLTFTPHKDGLSLVEYSTCLKNNFILGLEELKLFLMFVLIYRK